jgi:hypothetical protein
MKFVMNGGAELSATLFFSEADGSLRPSPSSSHSCDSHLEQISLSSETTTRQARNAGCDRQRGARKVASAHSNLI